MNMTGMSLCLWGAELPGTSDQVEQSLSVPIAAPSAGEMLIPSPDRFFDARIFDPADLLCLNFRQSCKNEAPQFFA